MIDPRIADGMLAIFIGGMVAMATIATGMLVWAVFNALREGLWWIARKFIDRG